MRLNTANKLFGKKSLIITAVLTLFCLQAPAAQAETVTQFGTWLGYNFAFGSHVNDINDAAKTASLSSKLNKNGIGSGIFFWLGSDELQVGLDIYYLPVYSLSGEGVTIDGNSYDDLAYIPLMIQGRYISKWNIYAGLSLGYINKFTRSFHYKGSGGSFGMGAFLGYDHYIAAGFSAGFITRFTLIFDNATIYNITPGISLSYKF
ncbi:MAG: hypothetical protein GY754_00895 [bacterium]|nr:hypothetical protein [bacterium]